MTVLAHRDDPHVFALNPETSWCEICGGHPDDVIHAPGWPPAEDREDVVTKDWAGLINIMDSLYPTDVFPVTHDHDSRDPGGRILSLLRRLHDHEELLTRITHRLAVDSTLHDQEWIADMIEEFYRAGRL